MKISVTSSHIEHGEHCSAEDCALALAFRAAGFDVMIGPDFVSFFSETQEHIGDLPLPAAAIKFRERFDLSEPVRPIEFEILGLRLPVHESRFTDHVPVPVV